MATTQNSSLSVSALNDPNYFALDSNTYYGTRNSTTLGEFPNATSVDPRWYKFVFGFNDSLSNYLIFFLTISFGSVVWLGGGYTTNSSLDILPGTMLDLTPAVSQAGGK